MINLATSTLSITAMFQIYWLEMNEEQDVYIISKLFGDPLTAFEGNWLQLSIVEMNLRINGFLIGLDEKLTVTEIKENQFH